MGVVAGLWATTNAMPWVAHHWMTAQPNVLFAVTTALAIAAKTGELHRNFQGYTADAAQTLIGIGATSIGRTPSGYVQNIVETGAWARAVAAGNLPVARGHALTQQDNLRAHVIERIMCDGKIDLAAAG